MSIILTPPGFDDGAPLKGIGSEHLRDKLILPSHLSSDVFGITPNITAIDPDDAGAAGTSGKIADAAHQHQFTTVAPASLTKTATSIEGSSGSHPRADHGHATDVLPWGVIAKQKLTVNSSTFTTNATTDFSLSSVAVTNTRWYMIYLSSLVTRSANGDWQINVHVGGTLLDEIGRVGDNAVGTNKFLMGIPWEPATGTFTVDIRVVEISGTADLTFQAGTTATRWFWIEDKGLR